MSKYNEENRKRKVFTIAFIKPLLAKVDILWFIQYLDLQFLNYKTRGLKNIDKNAIKGIICFLAKNYWKLEFGLDGFIT